MPPLRQGDPLSPYLFVMCAEVFSILLNKAQNDGVLHGFLMGSEAPPISHLLFADDSVLFGKATVSECDGLARVLNIYSEASGQLLNLEKPNVGFSLNTKQECRDYFKQSLRVVEVEDLGTYLGNVVSCG